MAENVVEKSGSDRLKEYFYENLLTITWTASALVGGLVQLIYHLSLAYIPDFQLTDLAGTLLSTTLTGLFFLALVMGLGLMPSYFLTYIGEDMFVRRANFKSSSGVEEKHDGSTLIKDGENEFLADRQVGSERLFPSSADHLLLWILPTLLFFVILTFSNFLPEYPIAQRILKWSSVIVFSFLVLLLLTRSDVQSSFFNRVRQFVNSIVRHPFDLGVFRFTRIRNLKFSLWSCLISLSFRKFVGFSVWLLLTVLPFWLAILLADTGLKGERDFAFICYILFFSAVNVLFYVGQNRIAGLLAACIFLFSTMLPIITKHPVLFPEVVVRMMGLGNTHASNLTLSYKQCGFLNVAEIFCKSSSAREPQMTLQNTNLLTRVGSIALVEIVGIRRLKPESAELFQLSRKNYVEFSEMSANKICGLDPTEKKADACGSCDKVVLEQTSEELKAYLKPKVGKYPLLTPATLDAEVQDFTNSLVCYRVAIPKDQITNMSIGGRKSYLALTEIRLPQQDENPSATSALKQKD